MYTYIVHCVVFRIAGAPELQRKTSIPLAHYLLVLILFPSPIMFCVVALSADRAHAAPAAAAAHAAPAAHAAAHAAPAAAAADAHGAHGGAHHAAPAPVPVPLIANPAVFSTDRCKRRWRDLQLLKQDANDLNLVLSGKFTNDEMATSLRKAHLLFVACAEAAPGAEPAHPYLYE